MFIEILIFALFISAPHIMFLIINLECELKAKRFSEILAKNNFHSGYSSVYKSQKSKDKLTIKDVDNVKIINLQTGEILYEF